jgi:TRAP-type C4-dicarboxylate transport system permease small subunit
MYRVPITGAFEPTQDRNWVIDFWNLDVKWVFAALPFGFLMMLLFYYDHVSFVPVPKMIHANLPR